MSKLKIGVMLTLFVVVGVVVYLFINTTSDDSHGTTVDNKNTEIDTAITNETASNKSNNVLSTITDEADESKEKSKLLSEITGFFNSDGFSVSIIGDMVTIKYDNDGFVSYVELNISNGISAEMEATYTQLNEDSVSVLYTREFKYSDTTFSGVNEFTIRNYLQSISDILKDSYSGFIHEGD